LIGNGTGSEHAYVSLSEKGSKCLIIVNSNVLLVGPCIPHFFEFYLRDNSIQKPGVPDWRDYKITRKLSKAVYELYTTVFLIFHAAWYRLRYAAAYTASDFSIILPFTPGKVVFSPLKKFRAINFNGI